jgi:26S proteasome regulatory subunit N1
MENEELSLIISRIQDDDPGVKESALKMLFSLTKSSHSKTINTIDFQYLSDNLPVLENISQTLKNDSQRFLYDIISAICVIGDNRKILEYRIKGNVIDLKEWGHLYVKKLVECILDAKYGKIDVPLSETEEVGLRCIDFLFRHNAEFDAIDFLYEMNKIDMLLDYVDIHNYNRIILYLEEMEALVDLGEIVLEINLRMKKHSKYVVWLINHGRTREAIDHVRGLEDPECRRQCLYILARCDLSFGTDSPDERSILSNSHIKDTYRSVARELEIERPNKIDMILKGSKHDRDAGIFASIAAANALVHMGHGRDPIFLPQEEDQKASLELGTLLASNSVDLISVLASIGVIEFWNSERVMEILQEHIFGDYSFRKTGSLLGLALSGLKNCDEKPTILALLSSNLRSESTAHVVATLLGIQALYSGTQAEELRELLQPMIFSESSDVAFFSAFVLGSVFCGSADEDITSLLLQTFVEKNKESEAPFFKFLLLGIGCLFFRRRDVECGLMEMGSALSKHGSVLLKGFQYARTGSSEVIESILTVSFTGETDAFLESLGLLSCSLVAIGDDLTTQMVARIVSSSLLLDSPHLRSVLPLCYSLLYPSNPQPTILDLLERSLNIGETNCVMSTLLSLGIIGAGSLNNRIIRILDQQYSFYYKDHKVLSVLKMAQGLVSMGKGLVTLSPLYYDKSMLAPRNAVGLFSTVFMFLDSSSSPLVTDHSYLFFLLCQSCSPKYVVTSEKISMRVGIPVNTVGVVGEPRKLSSIQTHTSPIVLNEREKAETDVDACTSYIEDVVILRSD